MFGAVLGRTKGLVHAGKRDIYRPGLAALVEQRVARWALSELDVVDGHAMDQRLNAEVQLTQDRASKT